MTERTISSYYEEDHDRLDELFKAFQQLKRSDFLKAKEAFKAFKAGLQRHIVWEEDLLFPLWEEKTGMSEGGPTFVTLPQSQESPATPSALALAHAATERVAHAAYAGLLEACADVVLREEVLRVGPVDVLLGIAAAHEAWTTCRITSARKATTGRRTAAITLLPQGPQESAAAFQARSVKTVAAAVTLAVARGNPQRGRPEEREKGQKARLRALVPAARDSKGVAKLGVDAVLAVKVADISPFAGAVRAALAASKGEALFAGRTDKGLRKGGRNSIEQEGEQGPTYRPRRPSLSLSGRARRPTPWRRRTGWRR